MKIGPRLELRQGQSLVMTQQLQQSIKLLQLSSLELNEFVDAELEKNPLLTREDGAEDVPASTTETPETERETPSEEQSDLVSDGTAQEETFDYTAQDDWGDNAPEAAYDSGQMSSSRSSASYSDDLPSLEQTLSAKKTLREHLTEQLHVDMPDPVQMAIGMNLIDMLDDAGYLRDDTVKLCEQLGVAPEVMEQTIQNLQRFDPPGVFARDLKECLKIQLIDKGWFDPVMEACIANLELFATGEYEKLRKLCNADDEDFAEMLAQIRLCNPKPASNFVVESSPPVVPDVFVRRGKKGAWMVELNHDVLPRVLLNQEYANDLSEHSRDKQAKKYISEQMANANWLVKALDQRAQTILKVSSEIVKQQQNFLLYGIQYLKPMTLRDIAGEVELHESTVSRVTTNKFMATPRGTFELKFFFTSSVSVTDGDDGISNKTVMHYIKELVDAEAPGHVLSDDDIVEKLKERNVHVARRTVAKYRDAMHIASSVIRRREKALKLSGSK